MPGGTSIVLAPSDLDPSLGVDFMQLGGPTVQFVTFDSWKAPAPDPEKDTQRLVSFDVLFKGADDLILNEQRREVIRLLKDAEESGGADGGAVKGPYVSLWVKFRNSPNYVYFDVKKGGKLDRKKTDFGPAPVEVWTITIPCELYARGLPIADDAYSATITNGLGATLFVPNVPGDVDALCQLDLKDVSTGVGVHLNGVLVFLRSQRFMAAGDFTPWLLLSAAGSGAPAGDTKALDGANTITLTTASDWLPLGQATLPAGGLNYGRFRILPHFKTSTAILDAPINLRAVAVQSGFSLPDGQYTIVITELDAGGHETLASDPVTATVHSSGGNTGKIDLTWTPVGSPTDHRVYFINTASITFAYSRFNTGGGTGSYSLTTIAGATTPVNPPTSTNPALLPAELRVRTALAAASPDWGEPGPVIVPQKGSSQYEYGEGGVFSLPPLPRQEGYADQQGMVLVEARNPGTASSLTMDCDGVLLVPYDEPSVHIQIPGMANTSARRFVIDRRRDGTMSGLITDQAGTPANITTVMPRGAFTVRRGNNLLCFAMESVGGVADVTDLKLQAKPTIIPLYLEAIGLVS